MVVKGFPEHAKSWRSVATPIGELVLLASAKGIAGLFFGHRVERERLPGGEEGRGLLEEASGQLTEYFALRRREFELPLDVIGTAFQQSVWGELVKIKFGELASYRDVAERIGKVRAVRAVGLANGANPVSVVVPCHRVIGANGALTGFGGGLELKRKLLEHEGAISRELL